MPADEIRATKAMNAAQDHVTALNAAHRDVAQSPHSPKAHYALAECLLAKGAKSEAIAPLAKAVSLNGKSQEYVSALSKTLEELGQTETAIAVFKNAVRRHLMSAQIHHQMGKLQMRARHFNRAGLSFNLAILLDRKNVVFHRSLAKLYQQNGQPKKAVHSLISAEKLVPDNLVNKEILVNLLLETHDWAQAKSRVMALQQSFQAKTGFTSDRADIEQVKPMDLQGLICSSAALYWGENLFDSTRLGETFASSDNIWPLGSDDPQLTKPPIVKNEKDPSAPLLSIVIPVYNIKNPDWLTACIKSVLAQDQGADWAEIIVIDDHSTNAIAKQVCDQFSPRLTYQQNAKNLGLVANFNACIAAARGTFIHILHQDDMVLRGFYDALLPYLRKNPKIVAGFSDCLYIDEAGHTLSQAPKVRPKSVVLNDWHHTLAHRQAHQFAAIIIRRSAFEQVGGFSPTLIFSFDWEMWSRLAAVGPFWYAAKPLAKFRFHQSSATYGIGEHARLVDVMRTLALTIGRLPKDCRKDAAQAVLLRVLRKYLRSFVAQKAALKENDVQPMASIFLHGWCSSTQAKALTCSLLESPTQQ